MKRLIAFFLALVCLLGLVGCSFVVREQQLMYDGEIYYYNEMGFVDELPDDYEQVGTVKQTSDSKKPTEDFHGCRVVVGQNVYAADDHPFEIYLEFESGYAKFTTLPAT